MPNRNFKYKSFKQMTLRLAVVSAFGTLMALPFMLSVASEAQASGYSQTSGIDGQTQCNPGGSDDCP